MGEEGKELLKQRIKNKRMSDGLAAISEDLLAKKPRYELTDEEEARQKERRQKNKEAAEKSRKKKKDEFEKLQIENDQLHQDKCELVAKIETLKVELNKIIKENGGLRCNMEQLKRWIGKRAKDLGLGKHMQKRQDEGKVTKVTGSNIRDCLLRGDPSLHNAGSVADSDQQMVRSSSPSLSTGSRSPPPSSPGPQSPPPNRKSPAPAVAPCSPQHAHKSPSPPLSIQDHFQPVGIRTLVTLPQLSTPVAVEQPQLQGEAGQREEVSYDGAKTYQPVVQQVVDLPEAKSMQISDGQQIVYLPKDAIFIVQGENGQQVVTAAPEMQQVTMTTPEVQEFTMATPEVQYITMASPDVQQVAVATTEVPHVIVETPEVSVSDNNINTREDLHGEMKENPVAAKVSINTATDIECAVPDTTSVCQPSMFSAIESLLKLGCKIQLPQGAQIIPPSAPQDSRKVTNDHDY